MIEPICIGKSINKMCPSYFNIDPALINKKICEKLVFPFYLYIENFAIHYTSIMHFFFDLSNKYKIKSYTIIY